MGKIARFMCVVIILILTFISLPSILTVSAQPLEPGPKISGLLKLQVEAKLAASKEAPLAEGRVDILQAMQATGAAVTPLNNQRIFIHLDQPLNQSQIEELESIGLTLYLDSWIPPVGAHPTGFIIADMPVDKLNGLAVKDYVVRLDTAERVFEFHNDLAAQKINADDVWASSYNGTGVTIAVLDSGLDVNHADIPTPTASWDYAEGDATIANTTTGHGTHVTGSALGRGTQSSGVYKGSAPGADLIFLKIGYDAGGVSTAAMINAMKAAIDTYSADVITMSAGGWGDYHDGTSQTAQAVNYAVSQGAVVFISAGNKANDDEHYSGTVAASSSTGFIQVNVTGAGIGNQRTGFAYNLVWYDGTGTSNDLELEYYDSSQNPLALNTTNAAQSESSRGTESEYSHYNSYLPTGSYARYLKVKNNSGNSQSFHIYYDSSSNYPSAGTVTFQSPDPDYTIGSPANADSAIAVGSYNTRQIWYDYANDSWWYPNDPVDQISTFSSRGPRVDTGAPSKVNVVAPGSAIISCRDDDVYTWDSPTYKYISNNGPNDNSVVKNPGTTGADKNNYYLMQGTSMACPIAAGVAALILEKNPTWTPAQVKNAIESTATDKGDAGWDKIYGWGLIDAFAAVAWPAPPPPTLTSPINDAVVAGAVVTFTWNAVSGATNYHIRVATDPTVESSYFGSHWTYGATSKTYNGFANDSTLYYWKVRAYVGGTWSDWSSIWSFTNGSGAPAPNLSSPGNGSTQAGTSITFTWNAVSGATNYHIRVATDPTVESSYFGSHWTYGATSKTYNGFANDSTLYYWKVRAYVGGTWSDWSSIWSFTNGPP